MLSAADVVLALLALALLALALLTQAQSVLDSLFGLLDLFRCCCASRSTSSFSLSNSLIMRSVPASAQPVARPTAKSRTSLYPRWRDNTSRWQLKVQVSAFRGDARWRAVRCS
jgi:hypothetical protein